MESKINGYQCLSMATQAHNGNEWIPKTQYEVDKNRPSCGSVRGKLHPVANLLAEIGLATSRSGSPCPC
jgi:hypothetical protein